VVEVTPGLAAAAVDGRPGRAVRLGPL